MCIKFHHNNQVTQTPDSQAHTAKQT